MDTRQLLRNAASNYGRMAISMVIALLMTPLVLHKLGVEGYGLWALSLTIAGYFSLTDLGVTSAAIRYISHYRALQDWEGLNRTIGATLIFYIGMSVVSLAIGVAVAFLAPHLFHVSPANALVLRLLVFNIGLGAALGFFTVLPVQCVIAAQRLDALNLWQLGVQLLTTALTLAGLWVGFGVLFLSVLQLLSMVFNGLIGYVLSRRYLPQAHFRPRWDKSQGKMLVSFASLAALISIAGRVIYYTDTLVIATFLSVAAVAAYAIALKFVEMMRGLVGAGMGALGTFVSEQNALDNKTALAQMWSEGTKWSLVITLPATAFLALLGPEVITAWVGPAYAYAGLVMAWLAIGQVFDQAQSSAFQVLMNTGRHKILGLLMLAEGVCNLTLSIWLIHVYGILGVAIGTALPLIVRCVFFYPAFMPRVTGLRLADYVRQAALPPVLATTPALVAVILYKFLDVHHSKPALLGLGTIVVTFTAVAAYQFCLGKDNRTTLKAAVTRRFLRQTVNVVA